MSWHEQPPPIALDAELRYPDYTVSRVCVCLLSVTARQDNVPTRGLRPDRTSNDTYTITAPGSLIQGWAKMSRINMVTLVAAGLRRATG